MNKEVSQIDTDNLKIIRNGVRMLIEQYSYLDSTKLKVLDVAPQIYGGASEFFLKSKVETLDIDPKSGATYIVDLCSNNSLIIPDDYFDLVICTEVLEHTLNPFDAVNEIFRILKKGGICLVSTPFNLRIHGPLPDCWRFTEHGLRSLFSNFEKVKIFSIDDEQRFLMPIQYHLIGTK